MLESVGLTWRRSPAGRYQATSLFVTISPARMINDRFCPLCASSVDAMVACDERHRRARSTGFLDDRQLLLERTHPPRCTLDA
jgi:hypothetical protein